MRVVDVLHVVHGVQIILDLVSFVVVEVLVLQVFKLWCSCQSELVYYALLESLKVYVTIFGTLDLLCER